VKHHKTIKQYFSDIVVVNFIGEGNHNNKKNVV